MSRAVCTLCCALMISGCGIYRGDATTSVNGRVLDEKGNPISGASVTLTMQRDDRKSGRFEAMKTDARGVFGVAVGHYPDRNLRFLFEVGIDGFQKYSEVLSACERYERDVKLVANEK